MMLVSNQTMEKKKQHKGNSCKNRFCPICSWKKARKDALALSVMMQYLKEEEQKEFIFLTLTAPNVKAAELEEDRKSTRLNSSHVAISYAVFCLKKKKRHKAR